MPAITKDYVDSLPLIYRDILSAFPSFEPNRRKGYGLAYQSLFAAMDEKWQMAEIMKACEQMANAGVVAIKQRFFVHPTEVGEELIAQITGQMAPQLSVPEFPPLPY